MSATNHCEDKVESSDNAPILRVLGPISVSAFSALSEALPKGTTVRSGGTILFAGQTCAVFEFFPPQERKVEK
jgi:hypothetical protein